MTDAQICAASYVGSDEHKDRKWWSGLGGAYVNERGVASRPKKQHTTICPLVEDEDREHATGWVQVALRSGHFLFLEADKDYPSKIWHKDENDRYWFGRCINSVLGHYKGWPIDESERDEVFGKIS
ncbi:hypothetical protein [Bradyrhizobium sp. SZCCHNRI3052]|uniref:hypothetical protein n=1 Tax=Bradyrhizobium sp. SZCCHNRI3052 TaxID=3057295 RepID=UPI002916900C|nr:hypothetical protein [Bradyrhizobium sp. SZCCHNRI3052]